MPGTPFFSLRYSPWLIAGLVVAACSSPKTQFNNLGGDGGDDGSGSGSGSGNPSGCAGLAACCASIADATTKMSCLMTEQTYAGIANGDQSCSVLLAQYQAASVCAGGSTTATTGAGGASGGGCAAFLACCAMIADPDTKQSCMTTESEYTMLADGGDSECKEAAMSYAAANLCMGQVTSSSTGAMTTSSSTTSGVGGMSAASSTAATTNAASSTGSGGNIIPSTCDQAHGVTGCCAPDGAVFYCLAGASQPSVKTCVAPQVCGWNAAKAYYTCVAPPSEPGPDPNFPLDCGP